MAATWVRTREGRARDWPPRTERESVELSVPAVVAIFVGGWLLELLAFAAIAEGAIPSLAPFGSPNRAVTRLLIIPGAMTLGISIGIVLVLGWHRAAGLGLGSASPWGIAPFAILVVASVVTAGLPEVSSSGPGFLGLLLLGVFLAATAEEVLFRGFLAHGLARRIGGRRAVLIGSLLFSAAHVPALVNQGQIDAMSLTVLFGFSVLMCKIRAETGSIWLASGVHTLWNFVTFAVLGTTSLAENIPPAFVAIKVIPVLAGLVIAGRLLAARDSNDPVAPLPPVFTSLPALAMLPPPPPPPPLRTDR
jgi:membrane protease YdiL (CAAX protease family)